MPTEPSTELLRRLRQLAAADAEPLPDEELLARFAEGHDPEALAALVRRHGPLVRRVARTLLGGAPEADDVFQATFLVLSRKAGSLRRRDALAGWLYGVAYRLALKARTATARRHAHESRAPVRRPPDPLEEITLREAQAALAEELQRLADRDRAPLLLCYWEGTTQEEAAQRLGWSLSTLKRRLERARTLLRHRLTRRGLTLAAVLPATLLPADAAPAATAQLADTTWRAALEFAAGEHAPVASARAVALAAGTLRAMAAVRITLAAGLLLLVGVTAGLTLGRHPEAAPADGPEPVVAAQLPAVDRPPRTDRQGDPLPEGAVARLGTIRLRHGALVPSIVFAPDGKSLASTSLDGFVSVWETATGKRLVQIPSRPEAPGGLDVAQGLVYAPDGKALAATRMNSPPCLWDAASGQVLREFGDEQNRAQWIALSPDGSLVAYDAGRARVATDPVVWLAETATGKVVGQVDPGDGRVSQFSFAGGGKTLAGIGDGTIYLWDVPSGKERHRFPGSLYAFTADGRTLAYLGKDRAIHLADPVSGKEQRTFGTLTENVTRLLFAPGGATLAAVGPTFLGLWDVATGRSNGTQTVPGGRRTELRTALFTPDGAICVSGYGDGSIRSWDARAGVLLRQFRAHYDPILTLALSPDGRTLASSCHTSIEGEHAVRLWETASGKPLVSDPGPQRGVRFLAFSPDGRRVAASSLDPAVYLYEADTGTPLWKVATCGPVAFTPDGKTLVSGGWSDGKLHFWEVATGHERRQFPAHPGGVACLALSPDGRHLACGGGDKILKLWDVETGREIRTFEGSTSSVLRLAFSPDGTMLAAALFDRSVRLWDVASGKVRHQIAAGTEQPGALAFSPDGKVLAWSDGAEAIHLADPATGKEIGRLQAAGRRTDPLDALAFSRDGQTLAWSGQHQRDVYLLDVATGQVRHELHGHTGHVSCLAFSADGRRLASGGADATVLVWDAR
jgi:RNA polymerase sigma factor (sigma-70 family)